MSNRIARKVPSAKVSRTLRKENMTVQMKTIMNGSRNAEYVNKRVSFFAPMVVTKPGTSVHWNRM